MSHTQPARSNLGGFFRLSPGVTASTIRFLLYRRGVSAGAPNIMARPSTYDPAYCEQVVTWGDEGKSLTWMAAHIGVSRECIYEWGRVHPEFSDALTQARLKCQAWWEDQGQAGLYVPGFNGGVWAKNMGSRFKDDWSDKSAVELTGKDGGPIKSEVAATVDVSNLSAEQLKAIASIPLNDG